MWILAGPNGSAKTTLYERFLARSVSTFVNPDRIAEELNPSDPAFIAWEAARLADHRRTALLRAGEDFVTETVFSHESKLDFIGEAKAAGFHTRILFICLESPNLNAARVRHRVEAGGHDVPGDRIAPRYERSLQLVVAARKVADELWLYDNSLAGRRPRLFARFESGELAWERGPIPDWARRAFGDALA